MLHLQVSLALPGWFKLSAARINALCNSSHKDGLSFFTRASHFGKVMFLKCVFLLCIRIFYLGVFFSEVLQFYLGDLDSSFIQVILLEIFNLKSFMKS